MYYLTGLFLSLLAALSNCQEEEKETPVVSSSEEKDVCTDKSSCLGLELDLWFDQLAGKKFQLNCNIDDIELPLNKDAAKPEPLYTVTDCNSPNAIWQYKYAGAKGKKRIPNGKGKLSFSRLSNPPHGYDYGMKSGICFFFGKPSDQIPVKSIEGSFVNGIPNGEAEVMFFDGTGARGVLNMGVRHGFVRHYVPVMDKDTNTEKQEKQLRSIAVYSHGVQFGHEWTVRDDGIKLLRTIGQDAQTFALVPMPNNETKYIVGNVDEDDMMGGARFARVADVKEVNCLKVVTAEEFGDAFDYDLQVKSKIKKTVAKLVRFFEIAADEKLHLDKNFGPNMEPVEAGAQKLIRIIKKGKGHFTMKTAQGEGKVRWDGSTKENGQVLSGAGILTFLSEVQRKDMYVAPEEAENGTSAVRDEKSEQDLQDFLDEYVALDMLPFRFRDGKKYKSIQGKMENSLLQGFVKVTHMDGSVLEGFCVDGVLHGVVREIDTPITKGKRKRYVSRLVENVLIGGGLLSKDESIAEVVFLGVYKNGLIDGPGWKFNVGGTFLFGSFQKTTTFTTNHGAYINQDLESAYVGRFVDGKMMAGQTGTVVGQRTETGGIRVPEFSALEEKVYRYVVPEAGELVDPLVTDVTEDIWVEVKMSELGGDSGEGLFATQDIPDNTVFSYFGGERFSKQEWNVSKPFDPNYWIAVDDTHEIIHLKDELGKDTKKYKATLGHKINHSFTRWNCMFHNLDHPRFGLIPAARTTESVTAGTEMLCMYQQEYDQSAPWFQELYRQQIDNDFVFGPFGHRGNKTAEKGEPIAAMLANSSLYKEFYKHAVEVLKLDPSSL